MPDIFDVIADPTRRDILRVLLDSGIGGDVSVSEIVGTLQLSQPTVSKHLKVLREAGLVHVREKGQHRYYSFDESPLEPVEDWLIPFTSRDEDYAEQVAEGLQGGVADFATNVGKVFADTSHRVGAAVEKVTSITRRNV